MLLPAQAALLGLSAAASPGPFQALLLERAARVGPRRALPLALVPLASDPPVVVACLFARKVYEPDTLRQCLTVLGGRELADNLDGAAASIQKLRWQARAAAPLSEIVPVPRGALMA